VVGKRNEDDGRPWPSVGPPEILLGEETNGENMMHQESKNSLMNTMSLCARIDPRITRMLEEPPVETKKVLMRARQKQARGDILNNHEEAVLRDAIQRGW